jgi:hypothetical protein
MEVQMNGIPGFQAESSLYPPRGSYRVTARASGAVDGFSMQASLTALAPAVGLGTDVFPPMRCCGYVPMLHRFVCTTRHVSPLEQCRCIRDFFGFPIILCQPPVATE